MNDTDFLSSSSYIYLPTVKNTKVALVADDPKLAKNAFRLYNPFSAKAKILKKITLFCFSNFNGISNKIFRTKKQSKSDFIFYLEQILGKKLVVSVYFSTLNDKVVLQLQTEKAEIIGYIKYPLNNIGIQHLENEKRAIEVLEKNKITNKYMLHDIYDDKPFLLLSPIQGEINSIDRCHVDDILTKFKREKSFPLDKHPRVIELLESIHEHDMHRYLPVIKNMCNDTNIHYALVYEHGDFTPWNIVKVDDAYIPFDFEYFVEDGLEYFDLIKYYYQTGKLLKKKVSTELIKYIQIQIVTEDINTLFKLFLIKEIVRNKEENLSFEFETNLLEGMAK